MLSFLLFSLTALRVVHAWGNLGHETVAYVATHYVESHTKQWAQAILGDTSTSYLANVATWADSYRYTTAGKFSAPFHFIDAQDDPPSSCNVDYDRDCVGTGCVVSAIANYTRRVQEPDSLDSGEIEDALKFIIHFVGDITQPLHDEAYEVGANDVDVTFNGDSTNLHHVWDTNAPEQLRGGYTLSDAQAWADDLVTQIEAGNFSSKPSTWIQGLNVDDAKTTALSWATDANAYVCSVVMPDGAQELEDEADLYPSYYDGITDTIELQIAKGGYRLAKWLDAVAANQDVPNSKKKRRDFGVESMDFLMGRDLLGNRREEALTPAQRRRAAVGWGCGHAH
ncbi:nuclease PA3 [Lecanosticta acicola]|uniref:Nuclease PA3 n=1 Tax=Lecanosticta acicola TaxID=111012 RepID=A0AAI8Z618_9PEZI|nr:nuclease PA3 [Lecanosticta acicola]